MTTRIPARLQTALATRAEANHRSANAELCSIIEAAISSTPARPATQATDLTPYLKIIQRLIDDSRYLRAEYMDLDYAVAQAQALLSSTPAWPPTNGI